MRPTLKSNGYQIIPDIYTGQEVESMLDLITKEGIEHKFGVREILSEYPELAKK